MLVKCVYTRHGIPGIAMLGNEVQLSRHECWLLVVNLGFRSVIPRLLFTPAQWAGWKQCQCNKSSPKKRLWSQTLIHREDKLVNCSKKTMLCVALSRTRGWKWQRYPGNHQSDDVVITLKGDTQSHRFTACNVTDSDLTIFFQRRCYVGNISGRLK